MASKEMSIISPMATISANKDYVTVLSIEDEPASSQDFFNTHMNDTDSRGHSYHRYIPSYSSDMRPTCSRNINNTEELRRRGDEIVEVNERESPKKGSLRVLGISPKQARRIEFDDGVSGSRAKSYHERHTGSSQDKEQFRRIHKSGFFGGLPDTFVEDFDDLLPEIDSENVRAQRIVLNQDTLGIPTGISVTEVPDPKNSGKLSAVEVYRIEENQRIALDGQLQIGDRIVKINNRPVYQMSLTAARLYLDELKREEEPALVFYRISKPDSNKNDSTLQTKPVTVSVQQGNTAALHNLKDIRVKRGDKGFGFGFASRVSERGNIFLITHVVPEGVSGKLLLSGDRLLKINDKDLSDLTQSEVKDLIKSYSVGDTIKLQISRTADESFIEQPTTFKSADVTEDTFGLEADDQILEFRIPVNEKTAAGLGLSLKGKQSIDLDGRQNAAVFIDRILRGSAAYKDGRLREDDRILGIENLNLLQFAQNSEAAHAFNSYVSSLPPSCAYFRIFIARKPDGAVDESSVVSRKAFISWMADTKNDLIRIPERNDCIKEEGQASAKNRDSSQEKDLAKADWRNSAEKNDDERSIASVQQIDPFNRESASRKSFSEKGPFGMRINPSKFENFKQISHQRQISAPTIGRRKRHAQFVRQRSAVILKNNTEENRPKSNMDPAKQKGFSFLSFFGLRNSTKASSSNKENLREPAQQSAKRRSMSEEPFKNENRLRTSASHHEKLSPTFSSSSPSNSANREALRKKRRSVGTSMLKFFQRGESPSKLLQNEENKTQQNRLSNQHRVDVSPQLRSLSSFQHRRFHSEHEGLKQGAWSPTIQPRSVDASGTSPNKQSSTRRRVHPPTQSFQHQQANSAAARPTSPPDYYNVFNQWFSKAIHLNNGNSVSIKSNSRATYSTPSIGRQRATSAYSTSKSPISTSPYLKQRHSPAYYPPPEYWHPAPFYPIQYSPTFPSAPPSSTQQARAFGQQYLYFGGIPPSAYTHEYFSQPERRFSLSTRSAPKFSPYQQPYDAVHVERF